MSVLTSLRQILISFSPKRFEINVINRNQPIMSLPKMWIFQRYVDIIAHMEVYIQVSEEEYGKKSIMVLQCELKILSHR